MLRLSDNLYAYFFRVEQNCNNKCICTKTDISNIAHSKNNPFVHSSFITHVTNTFSGNRQGTGPNCDPNKYLCGALLKVSVLFKLLMACSKEQPSADTAECCY